MNILTLTWTHFKILTFYNPCLLLRSQFILYYICYEKKNIEVLTFLIPMQMCLPFFSLSKGKQENYTKIMQKGALEFLNNRLFSNSLPCYEILGSCHYPFFGDTLFIFCSLSRHVKRVNGLVPLCWCSQVSGKSFEEKIVPHMWSCLPKSQFLSSKTKLGRKALC